MFDLKTTHSCGPVLVTINVMPDTIQYAVRKWSIRDTCSKSGRDYGATQSGHHFCERQALSLD